MLCLRLLLIWIAIAAATVLRSQQASAQTVVPIDWNRFSSPPLDSYQTDIRQFINRSAGYNLNYVEQTIPTALTSQTPTGRRYDMQSGSEAEVRTVSHIVYSAAAIMKSGAFDASLTGFNQTTFRNRTIEMIHGAAQEHLSNGSGVQWGNSWQSALWAAHLAEGAWIMWDDLPAATKTLVTNMTTYEANRFLNYNVPYWANPNGTFNTPGDTKAEENAWNSRILSVAAAMMPTNANNLTWRTKASELLVSSFARPSDLANPTVLDGKPVASWLHGYNAYEEGFVENHGFVHDDYMATTSLTIEPYITQTLAKQTIPQTAGFNANVVYDAMATVPVGGQQKPMFQRGPQGSYIADVYYPQGTDWSFYRYDIFTEMDAYANRLGYDDGKSYSATSWERARLDRVLQMQNRFTDGHLYAAGEFDSWTPREAYALQTLTNVWMLDWLDSQNALSPQGNWIKSPTPTNVSLLRLRVDLGTGEAFLINTSPTTTVQLDGYAISSLGGQLNPAVWEKLSSQGLGAWITANPSNNLLSELKSAGAATIGAGQTLSLGHVFSAAPTAFGQTTPADLQFEVTGPGGQDFESTVQYVGAPLSNTLSLVVDPVTGRALLRNDTPFSPAIEGYIITSDTGGLLPANGSWYSLHDQGAAGGWIEANSNANQLAELSSISSLTLSASSVFDLGKLFNPPSAQELTFAFLLAGEQNPMFGSVRFESLGLLGDYDHNGVVNTGDYVVWRKTAGNTVAPGLGADGNYDGVIDTNDYNVWRAHFGETTPGSGMNLGAAVPEPAFVSLAMWTIALALGLRKRSPSC